MGDHAAKLQTRTKTQTIQATRPTATTETYPPPRVDTAEAQAVWSQDIYNLLSRQKQDCTQQISTNNY
jgi:hypothetical protein